MTLLDGLGWALLSLVGVLLAVGFRQQFVRLSPRGAQFERFGLTPQWKFFGQQAIDRCDWVFEDMHLLVRRGGTVMGDWQEVRLGAVRSIATMLCSPHGNHRVMVVEAMETLVRAEEWQPLHLIPDCVPYLRVLRAVLDAVVVGEGEAVQFAVASSTGHRRPRVVTLRFLSAWHRP